MTDSAKRSTLRFVVIIFTVAAAVFGLDQISKRLIEDSMVLHDSKPIIEGLLHFSYVLNPGAAFSIAGGMTWVFSITASAVIIGIIWFARKIHSYGWAIMLAMLLGGTLGNLYDRLFRPPSFAQGYVVDFIDVRFFPAIFNVADIFIVSSMALLILLTLVGINIDGSKDKHKAVSAAKSLEVEDLSDRSDSLAEPAIASAKKLDESKDSQDQEIVSDKKPDL